MVRQRGVSCTECGVSAGLVHRRGVSCTECGFGGSWYTRRVSPVPSAALVAVGTPEGCLLYRVRLWWQLVHQRGCLLYRVRLWWQLVHRRGVSCTECGFGGSWYARGVSPVPSAALVAVGTPEGALRYKSTLKIPLAPLKLSKDLC